MFFDNKISFLYYHLYPILRDNILTVKCNDVSSLLFCSFLSLFIFVKMIDYLGISCAYFLNCVFDIRTLICGHDGVNKLSWLSACTNRWESIESFLKGRT